MSNQNICAIKFRKGDIVFAKVRGFPLWPSIVREVNGTQIKVDFFCSEKTWLVNLKSFLSILHFNHYRITIA